MLGLFVLREKMRGRPAEMAAASTMNIVNAEARTVYGVDQRASPTAMVLTGAIVGLVGMGLLSMNTEYIPKIGPKIFVGENVPLPPPPPIEKVEDKVEIRKAETQLVAPIPEFKTPSTTDLKVNPISEEIVQPFTYEAGTSIIEEVVDPVKVIDPPKVIDPILVKAVPDPRYTDKFQPDYPSTMIRMELTGTVNVRVLIGTDGRVKQVQIVSATDPAFATATERQALKSWRFKPATKDGVAYESWYSTKVVFKLDR